MKSSRLIAGGLAPAFLLAVGCYVGDSRSRQTTGQDLHGFGAGWYVVSPAGKKVERDG